jgi:hypothetical protein
MSGVPYREAVSVLSWIGMAPGSVRALRPLAAAWGPVPFDVDFQGRRYQVTFSFLDGTVDTVVSIRCGDRFSNDHDWIGEAQGGPYDALRDGMHGLITMSLEAAAERVASGAPPQSPPAFGSIRIAPRSSN